MTENQTPKPSEDIMLNIEQDRRILPNAPDPGNQRTNVDRRGRGDNGTGTEIADSKGNTVVFAQNEAGTRYISTVDVRVKGYMKGAKICDYKLSSVNISGTGILIACNDEIQAKHLKLTDHVKLTFTVKPGSMPEGFDTKIKLKANYVRTCENPETGNIECGFEFQRTLAEHIYKSRGRQIFLMSTLMLVFVVLFVVLLRAESIIYFSFNRVLYFYSIVAATFLLSRYFFGMLYRAVPIDPEFTPGVSIIIPCFNEEDWIGRTILSCMNQDYPTDKLEVIVVDDCSIDGSATKIEETIEHLYSDNALFDTKNRIQYFVFPENGGKREVLCEGVERAKHDLVVFVDSDSFLDPLAIRNLVQPFRDPKMGGVAGRTDVANVYTNWLTKMQTARYFIAFRIMKAAESYFDTVTCLSGPLACYRKEIVVENMEKWLNQKFLGQPATFGDDRSMTNMVLRNYRTAYQDTALCSTIVPNSRKTFLKQQIRWKRSWLRESVIAGSFIWKKEPFAALFFYMSFIIPFIAPIIVLYNFLYVPLTQRIFPLTFLVGFLMMTFLMSFSYLLFRRSRIWLYGALFCFYYLGVLLWQMPYAWFTFWKATWGTRMTPADIEEMERKAQKKASASSG